MLHLGGRGARHGPGGVCQCTSPGSKPWAEPGWKRLTPAENTGDGGRYSRVSLEGLGDPVGRRVQGRPKKEKPRKGD